MTETGSVLEIETDIIEDMVVSSELISEKGSTLTSELLLTTLKSRVSRIDYFLYFKFLFRLYLFVHCPPCKNT